ncbi:MAG: DUF11 domain-containing protein [Reyranella sp.]|nr:DUF11 domain-containing protein [Reyranella sp.]
MNIQNIGAGFCAPLVALCAALALPAAMALAQPQLRDPRPDLVISGIINTGSRVGVGETYFYSVTARNGGNAPCNFVNITVELPGEVDLVSASSASPLSCQTNPGIRAIGEPFPVACRGGPGFFLWPGRTVSASVFVRTLRPGGNVTARAVADPGNVCFEANEANNSAVSAPSTIIDRPRLKMTLNKPFAPVQGTRGSPGSQIFPVTIANEGVGAATDVMLTLTAPYLASNPVYRGPEIDVAYKGGRYAEGHTPPASIPPEVRTEFLPDGARRSWIVRLTLQPRELLQVHFRAVPCPAGSVLFASPPDIRTSTADDIAQDDHEVSLWEACRF